MICYQENQTNRLKSSSYMSTVQSFLEQFEKEGNFHGVLSQEGVTKIKFKTWNPWKRQFKCTEIVQFLKHLLIKLFCLSRLMDENLWGFTKLKKNKILKISAFYLNKQKSFIPNALPSAIPM